LRNPVGSSPTMSRVCVYRVAKIIANSILGDNVRLEK
jgi:hypothetical protein